MLDLTEIANEKLIGINSIPPSVLESIENIVDYLYKDEMQDWFRVFRFENEDFREKYYDSCYASWGAEPMNPNISICRTAIAEVKEKELSKSSTHIFEDVFRLMDWRNDMLIAKEMRLGI
jgi:hypothetical protein